MPGTRKLGRSTSHRMAMLKGMVTFLLEKGRIETTLTRAKEISALTDKMITLGKQNTLAARRQALSFLKKEEVVHKLFSLIAPLYEERNGGYTRVLKIGPRRGDGAEMAIIELVDAESLYAPKSAKEDKKAAKEAAKEDKKAEKAAKPAAKRSTKKAAEAETAAEAPVEETPEVAEQPETPVEEAPVEEAPEVAEQPEAPVEETPEAAEQPE